jgi:LemA protein
LKRTLIAIAILALLAAATAGLLSARNGLLAQREAIDSEWPKVAAALERRAEVAGSLARSVKAFAGAKNPVFDDIAEARAVLAKGSAVRQEIQANSRLMEACARLFLLAEQYPKLNSDREYRRASDEIKEAENAVAIERRKYNELLEHYNAQLERFPDNIAARISGLSRIDDYVITEQEVR